MSVLQLNAPALRAMLPRAPEAAISDFVSKQYLLDQAGITTTRNRLAIALAEVEHETNGFTIPNLTENIAYTRERAKQIWPSRARQIDAIPGSGRDFQLALMDAMYGGRMGNRPGTNDGSRYIGRGGPQWTGRDGYAEFEKRTGLPAVNNPEVVCHYDTQAAGLAAFWRWKNLNPVADAKGLDGVTRLWNGGLIGIADRRARLAGNATSIASLATVERIVAEARKLPGGPKPGELPPAEVIAGATRNERKARKGGAGGAAIGAGGEGANQTGTLQPAKSDAPAVPHWLTLGLAGIGVAVVIVATILIARKKAAVIRNWF